MEEIEGTFKAFMIAYSGLEEEVKALKMDLMWFLDKIPDKAKGIQHFCFVDVLKSKKYK